MQIVQSNKIMCNASYHNHIIGNWDRFLASWDVWIHVLGIRASGGFGNSGMFITRNDERIH